MMEFSIEELSSLEYNDAFDDEPDDSESDLYEEEDCCYVCGDILDNVTVGYNKEKRLFKYDCSNCGAVYVIPEDIEKPIIIKGEKRNWPEYLMEALEFPFEAVITEHNDREFFDPNYDGPGYMDYVKVLNVFYSMKYGVEASIRLGRKKYPQVLCFLEALNTNSRNYVELENYKRWREQYWKSDFLTALFGAIDEINKEQKK